MKLIALFLTLAILPLQKSFTGSPDASTNAPEYRQGTTRYFNMTPGGQQGNLVVVKENGKPGIWSNTYAKWVVKPGGAAELFFSQSDQLFFTNKEGRAGFGHFLPGFDSEEPIDPKKLFRFPFPEVAYYPSRQDVQYICLKMEGRWAVLGAEGFLTSPLEQTAEKAVANWQDNRSVFGKNPDESNAAFVMRQYKEQVSHYLHASRIASDPDAPGAYISLVETPCAGPYYLPNVPAGAALSAEGGIFGVKDNVMALAMGSFYCWNDDEYYYYEDLSVEGPYIPRNSVTFEAAQYPAIKGSDGGVFFGSQDDNGYGVHLRPDMSVKFGSVYLHFNPSYGYEPFDHPGWWEDEWKIPMDMTFRDFYLAYEFSAYCQYEYGFIEEYDTEQFYEKAKKIFLKATGGSVYTFNHPMKADSYNSEKQALKMVIENSPLDSFYIPMGQKDAEKLMQYAAKHGTDNLVWWYERDVDEWEEEYVSSAHVGWDGGKVFEYKAR